MRDAGMESGLDHGHRWTESDFPESFPKETVRSLLSNPKWQRWFPAGGLDHPFPGDSAFSHMVQQWGDQLVFLLEALHRLVGQESGDHAQGAIYGLVNALQSHTEDIDDILHFARMTSHLGTGYVMPRHQNGDFSELFETRESTGESLEDMRQ